MRVQRFGTAPVAGRSPHVSMGGGDATPTPVMEASGYRARFDQLVDLDVFRAAPRFLGL